MGIWSNFTICDNTGIGRPRNKITKRWREEGSRLELLWGATQNPISIPQAIAVQGLQSLYGDAGQSKDMATAIDEDVNDVLAGLDGQSSPSKRVKQERHEARQSQLSQFSNVTANGDETPSSTPGASMTSPPSGVSELPSLEPMVR